MTTSSARSKASTPSKHPSSAGGAVQSEKARLVLAGARTVFLANGFSAATTDMIQQAAGVSKSTVYSHYPNKEALFVAVVEAECERFLRAVRKPKFPEERLADILNAMALAYLEIVLSRDGLALYRMIAAEAPRFPELGRRFYLAGPAAINNIVAETLEVAASKGELDLGSIGLDSAASLFVNMVRGEAQMQCVMHPDAPASAAQRDRWAKDAVTTFLRAFQKNDG
ncbi:TetR family transcriptional regulator [Burkholderia vietnamiensis]|uniref:TetR/AcrR family transcriptional regulator n=1 Tax=Burkholderia vietnamiensis TaxID=60552 RepID=UPI000770CF37|nr:TetR/AcrR family transcriptional regulator [Burkholderia vietnamiensis]KVR77068.1 TetR family transcriptional regulator [Burkholderia vietnamiensis]